MLLNPLDLLGHCFYFWSKETVISSENLSRLYISLAFRIAVNCIDNWVYPLVLSINMIKGSNLENVDALREDFYSVAVIFCHRLMVHYSENISHKCFFMFIFHTYEKSRDYFSKNTELPCCKIGNKFLL